MEVKHVNPNISYGYVPQSTTTNHDKDIISQTQDETLNSNADPKKSKGNSLKQTMKKWFQEGINIKRALTLLARQPLSYKHKGIVLDILLNLGELNPDNLQALIDQKTYFVTLDKDFITKFYKQRVCEDRLGFLVSAFQSLEEQHQVKPSFKIGDMVYGYSSCLSFIQNAISDYNIKHCAPPGQPSTNNYGTSSVFIDDPELNNIIIDNIENKPFTQIFKIFKEKYNINAPPEILDNAKQYESTVSFLQEKLSELRKNNKFLLIHSIDSDKNATNISIPVNDINDLNLLSNVQGVYSDEDKAVYIPKWVSSPHPIAHEIGHALDNAKAPNFNKDPNKFSNLSSSDKTLRTLYVNYYNKAARTSSWACPDIWSKYAVMCAANIIQQNNGDFEKAVQKGVREYIAEGTRAFLLENEDLKKADNEMYLFTQEFLTNTKKV